jgi:preprotein translocase subunit SecF
MVGGRVLQTAGGADRSDVMSDSTTQTAERPDPTPGRATQAVKRSAWGRLVESQTAIDFVGRRWVGITISLILILLTVISLWTRGLNLGIDFEGGVSWDVPAENGFTAEDAEDVLADNDLSAEGARIQERSSDAGTFIKVQVGDQPGEIGEALRQEFADAAGVDVDTVNVNLVSSTWGEEITEKAIRALVIFLSLVALFIAFRFEWRMAIAAILAMVHDVVISVGIYSIFQFVVTPATVIAFLTILGYSLYDTVVVFDRIRENEARVGSKRPLYADIVNVSMNQVLMRSLNTSFSAIIPVMSLLVIGAWIMGQSTLTEFAVALLIGMLTGAYSSILVAVPILFWLKQTDATWKSKSTAWATGEELRELVMAGGAITRRTRRAGAQTDDVAEPGDDGTPARATPRPTGTASGDAAAVLSHAPRPRKKTKR